MTTKIKSISQPRNLKRGYVREDGYVFLRYTKQGYAHFVSPESLAKMKGNQRVYSSKWYARNRKRLATEKKAARLLAQLESRTANRNRFGPYTIIRKEKHGLWTRISNALFGDPVRAVATAAVLSFGVSYAALHIKITPAYVSSFQPPVIQLPPARGATFSF